MPTIKEIDDLFVHLESKDDKERYQAFQTLLEITEKKVQWIYDKWYMLIEKISSDNSYQRSIGLLLIANLAKSDEENRISKILNDYLIHLEDEKFITSRQCIQNIWKIALSNKSLEKEIVKNLIENYCNNIHLKTHGNLIKQDIVSSLGKIFLHTQTTSLLNQIQSLIEEENDIKLKKILIKSSGIKLR